MYTYEGLKTRKEFGMKNIKNGKYQEAEQDFTIIIDNLFVENDQKAILKCQAHNFRSLARIKLGKLDDALEDANDCIRLYTVMRPEKLKIRKNDPLSPCISQAFTRRGQVFMAKKEYLEAFRQFKNSQTAYQKGDGNAGWAECFAELGVPEIDKDDESLAPFSNLYKDILDKEEIFKHMVDIVKILNENKLTQEDIDKLDLSGVFTLFGAVMQLYPEEEQIVDLCLTFLVYFGRRGSKTVWNCNSIIPSIFKKYEGNKTIINDCIRFLATIPSESVECYSDLDTISLFYSAFSIEEIKDENLKELFTFFDGVIKSREVVIHLQKLGFVEKIVEKISLVSTALLLKLAQFKEICMSFRYNGILEYICDLLVNNKTNITIAYTGCGILCKVLECVNEEPTESIQAKVVDVMSNEDVARRSFDSIVPCIIAHNKQPQILKDAFLALIYAINLAPEKVAELKVIQAASIIMAVQLEDRPTVFVILTFLVECAKYDNLIEIIKTVPNCMPNVMKTIRTHAAYQQIIEKAVVLVILVDHPNKIEILKAALTQFRDSKILKQYISLLPIPKL